MAARSDTPMNLRRMLRKVLSFEESSGAFSALEGVEAREGTAELVVDCAGDSLSAMPLEDG